MSELDVEMFDISRVTHVGRDQRYVEITFCYGKKKKKHYKAMIVEMLGDQEEVLSALMLSIQERYQLCDGSCRRRRTAKIPAEDIIATVAWLRENSLPNLRLVKG